jgi:D-sedoheptulose 7-phosphate isomerase
MFMKMTKRTEDFKRNIDLRIEQFTVFLKENRDLFKAINIMEAALKKGNKILVFGNGGSATQSSHLAAELVNKFYFERKGLPAIALTSNMANVTSIANDMGFKYIFSRQLETLGQKGDIAMGLTTSGKSANVLEALKSARRMNMKTIALCGRNTRPLQNLDIDVIVNVKSENTPVIQEMHLFILHTIAEILEKNFFGGKG